MIKVQGIGGVFFKTEKSTELAQWYKEWLGFELDAPYCASFKPANMPEKSCTVWGSFKSDSDYFEPSDQQFMINLIVEDVEQALKQVEQGGAKRVGEVMDEGYGIFGWFIDPAGFKVELWCPK